MRLRLLCERASERFVVLLCWSAPGVAADASDGYWIVQTPESDAICDLFEQRSKARMGHGREVVVLHDGCVTVLQALYAAHALHREAGGWEDMLRETHGDSLSLHNPAPVPP